jgi:RND family efflux transporter MFP subunit
MCVMRFTLAGSAIVVCLVSCSKAPPPHPTVTASVVVAVERATYQDLSREETLAAEFRPYQEIDVHAKVAGYVKKIYVDVGDRLRQGQTIATLEIPEMADELTRVRATKSRSASEVNRMREELARAEAAHTAAHTVFQRLETVAKTRPTLIAAQEIDDARGRDQAAEAQISAARAALESAQQQVDVGQADVEKTLTMNAYATITAPFAGIVTHRYADTGAMIPAGTSSNTMPVIKLSQNSTLRLILPVPESLSARVHRGDSVQVQVGALNKQFTGRVTRMADSVSTSTRTMETEIDVPNPSLELIPGMYAKAVLSIDRRPHALTIPLAAIAGTEAKPAVYLVDPGGHVRIQPVTLGLQTADRAQVLSGLEDGAMVVTSGRAGLTAGQAVTPKIISGGKQ